MSVYLFIKFKEADFFLSILRLSISKSSLSQVGILIFLANEKKQPPTIWRPTWHFWEVGKFYPFDAHICARGNALASRSPSSPRLSDGGGARTDMAAASSSTSHSLLLQLVADDAGRRRPLRAPDRRLHPCEADGVAARYCRRHPPAAVELPFPTLLLPN